MKSKTYETIHLIKGTKARLLSLKKEGETQDATLNRIIDDYKRSGEMREFWEKYHDYEEAMKLEFPFLEGE